MTGIEPSITIIIADFAQSDSIVDCLKNLDSWSPKKILVSNDLNAKNRLNDDFSHKLIFHKSKNIYQLWEQGLAASNSKWNLLITSNENVTGHLKNSIESKIKAKHTTDTLFKIKKKVVFLKKVLKYPLEWSSELSSCLIFIHHKDNFILKAKTHDKSPLLQGELIQFSSPTIEDGVKEIFGLAEAEADKLFLLPEPPKLTTLTVKTFFKFSYTFFNGLILKKGFKEGYEGIIYSTMNSMIPHLTLFRYFEKYHRSGKRIENKLNKFKNILVIKVRGAGDLVLSTPFLRNLKETLQQYHITVVVGPINKHIKNIKNFLVTNNFSYQLIVNPENIFKFFLKSDLAISGGGVTCYELLKLGIPTIGVSLNKGQSEILNYLKRFRCINIIDFNKDKKVINKNNKIVNEIINGFIIRKRMSEKSKKVFKYNGLKFLTKNILQSFKEYEYK